MVWLSPRSAFVSVNRLHLYEENSGIKFKEETPAFSRDNFDYPSSGEVEYICFLESISFNK